MLLATAVPAFCSFLSCTKLKDSIADGENPFRPLDSLTIEISVNEDVLPKLKYLDIFLYSATGTEDLESHMRIENFDDAILYPSTSGRKKVVVIANSPKEFNLKALERYDSMELVSYSFLDDNPEYPVMSDWFQTNPSSAYVLNLKPLMCKVVLDEVTNGLNGYRCLEDPKVYLTDMNPFAAVLKTEGFRLETEYEDFFKVSLPCDVGFYTQHPETVLYCYPNDTPDNMLGSPRTGMVFECEIRDTSELLWHKEYRIELPPIKRAATVHVSLEVLNETECRSSAVAY